MPSKRSIWGAAESRPWHEVAMVTISGESKWRCWASGLWVWLATAGGGGSSRLAFPADFWRVKRNASSAWFAFGEYRVTRPVAARLQRTGEIGTLQTCRHSNRKETNPPRIPRRASQFRSIRAGPGAASVRSCPRTSPVVINREESTRDFAL